MDKSNLDEYIKRGDAIEALEDDYNLCFAMDHAIPQDFAYYKVKQAAVRIIASVDAANVAPVVKGKWITSTDKWGNTWYRCSECGHEMFFAGTFDEEQHFCYYCGAALTEEALKILEKRSEGEKDEQTC